MASVIPDAIRIFREAGYETVSGLSPYHVHNKRDAPFTTFVKNKKMFGSPGLALQEVMFLENFRDYIAPERILVVGNAYGWSTVVTALVFPRAMKASPLLRAWLARLNGLGVRLSRTLPSALFPSGRD